MSPPISLPYGRRPLSVRLPGAIVADLPRSRPGDLGALLSAALDAPVASPRLEQLAVPGARVLVIVSDATRAEPRAELLGAVLDRLPAGTDVRLAVAHGTHEPGPIDRLGIPAELLARVRLVEHDARTSPMVELGRTRRGTPVVVNRCLLDADVVVATGRIKPHYFAGFGAGAKAIFPGLGEDRSIRANHELKRAPGAHAGVVDGNPCREDLEEAAAMVPARAFLLDCVLDADGAAVGAVAGDVRAAYRAGAELARPLFAVRAPRSRAVVVSDKLPLTASLYQASKLAATGADLLEPGGTLVMAAECGDGVGPIEVVNRKIWEIGIRPRLPVDHRVVLVSSMPRALVEQTYCAWAATVEEALAGNDARPTVLPRAGDALVEVAGPEAGGWYSG